MRRAHIRKLGLFEPIEGPEKILKDSFHGLFVVEQIVEVRMPVRILARQLEEMQQLAGEEQDQTWSFWDTGSGGKKTLFNVCYALALHHAAMERGLPVPSLLIIDSPTKNISEDENPELVRLLYNEIYRLARTPSDPTLQFLLIDSDLVLPSSQLSGGFSERRMAGEQNAPRLISYYTGP